ncbi:MAG: hypothetical protein IKB10_01960 [Alphaproteobacteria bacterium]|nr:hypothetical protein [Alphaproteobacteria bacterium]
MTNKPTFNKKNLLYLAGGIVATYAISTIALFIFHLVNYDKMDCYNNASLKRAKESALRAMDEYNSTQTKLEQDSYDELYQDATYLNMHTKAEILKRQLQKCDPKSLHYANLFGELHQLYDDIALREDSLRRTYINNHPAMRIAGRQLKHAETHLARVYDSCKKLDSIKQVPTTERIKSNWNRLCADWRMVQNTKKK